MTDKDIALTVGGILATMVLAFMLWRRQQDATANSSTTTAATNSSAATDFQDVNSPGYYDQQALYDSSMEYTYGSQLASMSVPTTSSTAATSTTAPAVDVSSSTAAGQNDGEAITDILGGLFNEYMAGAPQSSSADFSSLVIPALTLAPGLDTSNIPVTAAQAAANSATLNNPATTPVSDTATAASSTAGLHFNHIIAPVAS